MNILANSPEGISADNTTSNPCDASGLVKRSGSSVMHRREEVDPENRMSLVPPRRRISIGGEKKEQTFEANLSNELGLYRKGKSSRTSAEQEGVYDNSIEGDVPWILPTEDIDARSSRMQRENDENARMKLEVHQTKEAIQRPRRELKTENDTNGIEGNIPWTLRTEDINARRDRMRREDIENARIKRSEGLLCGEDKEKRHFHNETLGEEKAEETHDERATAQYLRPAISMNMNASRAKEDVMISELNDEDATINYVGAVAVTPTNTACQALVATPSLNSASTIVSRLQQLREEDFMARTNFGCNIVGNRHEPIVVQPVDGIVELQTTEIRSSDSPAHRSGTSEHCLSTSSISETTLAADYSTTTTTEEPEFLQSGLLMQPNVTAVLVEDEEAQVEDKVRDRLTEIMRNTVQAEASIDQTVLKRRRAIVACAISVLLLATTAGVSIVFTRKNGNGSTKDDILASVPETICNDRFPGQQWNADHGALCTANQTASNGGGVCNIVAKAFVDQNPAADFCIINAGSCRSDITKGTFTLTDASILLPYDNTLETLNMTGSQVVAVLNEALAYALLTTQHSGAYPYGNGIRYDVDANISVVSNVEVNPGMTREWKPIDMDTIYQVVTHNFLGAGGDGYITFSSVPDKLHSRSGHWKDAFVEHITEIGVINDLPLSEYSTQKYVPGNDQ